jgi:hypothetical protein
VVCGRLKIKSKKKRPERALKSLISGLFTLPVLH